MAASEKELLIRISGKADSSLNAASQQAEKAFQKITSAAKTLGYIGGAAVVGATAAAIDIGKEYEAQMSTVQAISGATAKEYEQLDAKAQEMGISTQFSATESAQAMEYMAMAGWKTEDMLGGIEGIMNLAAASGESLSSVSDIVTDALTAFNLTAEDSGHFADVLAKASSNSNTNVAMMGETFKYVASVAGALGYSAEDTAVSVGLLANSGIKASQAGTITRRLMSETAGGIELVSKAYAKHGKKTGRLQIQTANADGSMKDWSETVGRLREEFAKMTEEEQAANAESIGGKTAMAGLLAIVNASEKDYKKLTKEINNASGATKEMADIRMDNLEGDIKLFQSALEGKGIELYNEIKEPLRELTQDATQWLSEIDVGRVVDDFMDLGESVLDFAEPFFEVGEWMLENPEVISGTLAGIGGVIATYKLTDTVSKVGDGVMAFGKSLMANPWMAGGALAVGAIAGIGTAVSVTQRKLANASLEDHFGDISLSMKEIKETADDIIGERTLDNIGKLFVSNDEVEKFADSMEEALASIDEVEWKISAGIKLDKADMVTFEKNVKAYVSDAQDLLDKKGYTVNVATKVLFGNSARGKELIEEDNSFFADLEKKSGRLAKRINNTLEKAMKEGLTPDLQKALDGYIDELEKITSAKTEAESEAKWEMLSVEFSGKELDADSYQRMQEALNKNVEEIEKGSKEALETKITNSNWEKNLGYISEAENEQRKGEFQKEYEENVKNAEKKSLEFQYNTLMDTYGKEIAGGDYDAGDKKAIQDIINPMMEKAQTVDYDMYEKLLSISLATTSGYQNSALSFINGVYAKQEGKGNIYETANRDAQNAAKEYLNQNRIEEEKFALFPEVEIGKNIFGHDVDFASMLIDPAKEGGLKASAEIENTIKKELENGINAHVPISLSGTFSLNGGGLGSLAGGEGEKKNNSGGKVVANAIPGYAAGTISTKQHIAAVSEGNKMEAIIPIDGSERSRRLYEATGKLMGATAETQTVFSPRIEINVSGSATKEDGRKIGDEVQKAVEKVFRKMVRDNKRFRMR